MSKTSTITSLPLTMPSVPDRPFDPIIIMLRDWAQNPDGTSKLDKAVKAARSSSLVHMLDEAGIVDTHGFLKYANAMLRWVPRENQEAKGIYNTLCLFYFVLAQSPLREAQTPVAPESAGKDLTFLSSWLITFAQLVGLWMDNPESITPETLKTFEESPMYNYDEWVIPEGGFKTFNQFFYRFLKDGTRPIAEPENPNVVVYPADSTFDSAYDISPKGNIFVEAVKEDTVNVKSLEWGINDLLQGSKYADEFEGGVWMHSFLNAFNYHRQNAPVTGKVVEARIIQGAAYFDVRPNDDGSLKYHHRFKSANTSDEPQESAPECVAGSGFQFIQTRALIMIESPELGLVAVMPIGMAQVSAVQIHVNEGQQVKKGDDISNFRFGGSDIVVVFQAKAGLSARSFQDQPTDQWSKINSRLCTANPIS